MYKESMLQDKQLWDYPIRIADVLWGTHDIIAIANIINEFAHSYDDTIDLVSTTRKIVRIIIMPSMLPSTLANQMVIFKGLDAWAFESFAANHGWFRNYGEYSSAAVFIWTSQICLVTSKDYRGWGAGFDSSRWGLSCYCLTASSTISVVKIIADMCRTYITVSSWRELFYILQLYGCACERLGIMQEYDINVIEVFRTKPRTVDLMHLINEWWNPENRTLSSFATTQLSDISKFMPVTITTAVSYIDTINKINNHIEHVVQVLADSMPHN